MKKETAKKLNLGKIKIASLSNTKQDARKGDENRPTYTGCSLFRCPPPPDGN